MKFSKKPKTIADQVALSISRGLIIEDEAKAIHILSNISYYRLSAYFHSFQKYGDPLHKYMPWATFKRVVDLYEFDRELRMITLDAIERIEIAIRCRLVFEYCIRYGNNWYEDTSFFTKGHAKLLARVYEELARSKELFIQHYYSKYSSPQHPPAWMAIEILSFGQLSILFKNLRSNDAKKAMAEYFGVGSPVLESWFEHLVYIRNICAHHSRLWNRSLTIKPTIPLKPKFQWISRQPSKPDKVYVSMCIIAYLHRIITPKSIFKEKLVTLCERFFEININSAGFPDKWLQDSFWQNITSSTSSHIPPPASTLL